MQLIDLLEYKVVKGKDFNVFQNPSAIELEQLVQNSYVMQNLTDFDFEHGDMDYDQLPNISLGHIHGLDYPLRGFVVGQDIYLVDSYHADHDTLSQFLMQTGIIGPPWELKSDDTRGIPFSIDRILGEKYVISTSPAYVSHIQELFAIKRLKLLVKGWS